MFELWLDGYYLNVHHLCQGAGTAGAPFRKLPSTSGIANLLRSLYQLSGMDSELTLCRLKDVKSYSLPSLLNQQILN